MLGISPFRFNPGELDHLHIVRNPSPRPLSHFVGCVPNRARSYDLHVISVIVNQSLVNGHSNLLRELRETLNVGFDNLRKRLGRRFNRFRAISE